MANRLDVYKDGRVFCDYYPGKKAEIRAEGFKVVVYKPYTMDSVCDKDSVYIYPQITMSTNSTVSLSYDSLDILKKSVDYAINLLNLEGYNLIKVEEINKSGLIEASKNPYLSKIPSTRTKTVRYDDVNDVGSIITAKNLSKYLYLGKGSLYESYGTSNVFHNCNRSKSDYIYYKLEGNEAFDYDSKTGLLKIDGGQFCFFAMDTVVTKRTAIEVKPTIDKYIRVVEVYLDGKLNKVYKI